jgi:hypothetical protein
MYVDIEIYDAHEKHADSRRWWRATRENAKGDNDTAGVHLTELDEEDGMNAKEWFDWKDVDQVKIAA